MAPRNGKQQGFWKQFLGNLGCIPVYIQPAADKFDALDKPKSARRAADRHHLSPRESMVQRQQQAAPPPAEKLRALDIPVSAYISKPPSQRQPQSGPESDLIPAVRVPAAGSGDRARPASGAPKAVSSNGSSGWDSSPHDRDGRAQLPAAKSRSGAGVSPLGAPVAGSGGIGRGRLQPGEDPMDRMSGKNLLSSRAKTATGTEKAPMTAMATVRAAAGVASGSGPRSLGDSIASGSSGAHPAQGGPEEGRTVPAVGSAPLQPPATAPQEPSAWERAAADGVYGRQESGVASEVQGSGAVHYVSDYYPSDNEQLVAAESSYATPHIYGHATAGAGHRGAKDGPAGHHSTPREESSGGANAAGDGVREHMNAALARMRHNSSAPRQKLLYQVSRAGSEHNGPPSAREDSVSVSTSAAQPQAQPQAHAPPPPGEAHCSAAPSPAVSRQASQAHHQELHYQQYAQRHTHHSAQQHAQHRHQSPARHALPHFGSAHQVESAGTSFNSGAMAVFPRQASTSIHHAAASAARIGHELALAARQASVAVSNSSSRQVAVSRTASVTAMNMKMLPVMSTVMLATRRFGGGGGHRGGDSGAASRVGSMTHATAGGGGTMLARNPYDPAAFH